jgi:hypothetical protein
MADLSLVGVGATACALSTVFGWIAIKRQLEHRAWCARGVKADGVVSRLAERRGTGLSEDAAGMPTDPNVSLVPVVRFRAANGIEYEIDAPEAPATIGSVVQVAYDPALPSGARAIDRTPKVGCAVVLFVAGVALVVIGMNR